MRLSFFKRVLKNKKPKPTLAQRKRASVEYRTLYFEKNPGILGTIWFCAYCGAVLTSPKQVEVDHIIPLASKFGLNVATNLVSSCRECNRSKSDKVDMNILKGFFFKGVHSSVFGLQYILKYAFVVAYYILKLAFRAVYQALLAPFRGTNFKIKIVFGIFYCYLASLLLTRLGIL